MSLPVFKYHPDPISTGSIQAREVQCVCCEETREYVYVGPVYCRTNLDEAICPWCISSRLAYEKYEAEFTDIASIGGYDDFLHKTVSKEVKEEIAYRTPGFCGWQQERWLAHCNDACAFLGPAGKKEVEKYNSQELLESLRADIYMNEEDFHNYLNSLDKEYGPTAYIFQCLHCGKYMGYSDFT
jgi:uncharacterized protein CbrC (UPF0167 family)